MKFKIKVQSVSDIITNSSSEMFMLFPSNFTYEEFLELVKEQHEKCIFNGDWEDFEKMTWEERQRYDTGTGMGGLFEIFNAHRRYVSISKEDCIWEDVKDDPDFVNPDLSFEEYLETIDNDEYGGRDSIVIDLDQGFNGTINWLKTEFNAVRID